MNLNSIFGFKNKDFIQSLRCSALFPAQRLPWPLHGWLHHALRANGLVRTGMGRVMVQEGQGQAGPMVVTAVLWWLAYRQDADGALSIKIGDTERYFWINHFWKHTHLPITHAKGVTEYYLSILFLEKHIIKYSSWDKEYVPKVVGNKALGIWCC